MRAGHQRRGCSRRRQAWGPTWSCSTSRTPSPPTTSRQARENVIDALRELDWSGCTVTLRINGLDTHYCYRDIVDVVEQSGEWLDTVLVPKASCAGDIHLVATLLTQIEDAMGLSKQIGISALIETAPGMLNVDEIAASCPERMEALIFGVADYAASMQSQTASIGGSDANYAVITDPNGGRTRRRGTCTGATSGTTRWRGSPSPAGRTGCGRSTAPSATSATPRATWSPPAAPRSSASRASGASIPARSSSPTRCSRPTSGWSRGPGGSSRRCRRPPTTARGAVSLDGRLIDAASLRMAEHLLTKIELIEERQNGSRRYREKVAAGA